MAVVQTILNNPWKIIFGSSGTIITLVGALFAIDARYAHAADVDNNLASMKGQIQKSMIYIRKQNLEDKLFEFDIKKSQDKNGKLSPIDQALQGRYQQQLEDLNSPKEPKEK